MCVMSRLHADDLVPPEPSSLVPDEMVRVDAAGSTKPHASPDAEMG